LDLFGIYAFSCEVKPKAFGFIGHKICTQWNTAHVLGRFSVCIVLLELAEVDQNDRLPCSTGTSPWRALLGGSCLISDCIPEMVGDVDTGNAVGYELLSNIFAAGVKCPPIGRANTHPVASMCAPSIVGLQSNLLNVLLLLE
jgi:hypothetical protein